jgi:hypothetical protein
MSSSVSQIGTYGHRDGIVRQHELLELRVPLVVGADGGEDERGCFNRGVAAADDDEAAASVDEICGEL